MNNSTLDRTTGSGERAAFIAIAVLALGLHLFLVTRNWHAGQLTGHEFRQTQTAISSYFIQREHNFSLAYPTPVLGKPWSIPMEFPLYQWSVVALDNLTHQPLAESGRAVSLACFYLALPALYLLLGQLGLAPLRRLPGLALALTSPVFIFYSRAFLMESMALMFSVWFLVAFLRTMETRRLTWLTLAAFTGTGAALVKITTLLAWLLPAAGYSFYCIWRDWPRTGGDWKPLGRTLGWGAAGAVVPCVAGLWWVDFANRVKAANVSGAFLTSEALHMFNVDSWRLRFSSETWIPLLKNWQTAVMPPALMGALLLVAFLRWRRAWLALVAGGLFLIPQLVFPILFSLHDYYFYAIALFWLIATALVLEATDAWLPRRWLAVPLLLLVAGLQLGAYRHSYYSDQTRPGNGGSHLTNALRDLLPPESVIVVAGDDWSSVIPYYTQRRALMLRRGHENDWPYIDRAFATIAGEDVSALVLVGDQRGNRQLIEKAAQAFSVNPVLCLTHGETDIYISNYHRESIVRRLRDKNNYGTLAIAPQPIAAPPGREPNPVPPALWDSTFKNISPKPTHSLFMLGLELANLDGMEVLGAHPDATLWLTPPAGAKEILWEFAIYGPAYTRDGDKTDGVEFILQEEHSDGTTQELYRRVLDPVTNAADRGLQTARLAYTPVPGARLIFMTRPNHTSAFDWAYWRKIEVK